MPKWAFVALVLVQVHFVASYLVPLDTQAQGEFRGLLRWAWPWSDGDGGPIGQVSTAAGVPFVGLLLAMAAGVALAGAALAVIGVWIPHSWWQLLTLTGAVLSLFLLLLFLGWTKLIPIAVALFLIWFTVSNWTSTIWTPVTAD